MHLTHKDAVATSFVAAAGAFYVWHLAGGEYGFRRLDPMDVGRRDRAGAGGVRIRRSADR